MIAPRDKVPHAVFKVKTDTATTELTSEAYFGGAKVVVFGLPGAFTPTCSRNHLPGYLEHFDELKAKGVDKVAVVAVNDHHVMHAWAKATGGEGKIDYL